MSFHAERDTSPKQPTAGELIEAYLSRYDSFAPHNNGITERLADDFSQSDQPLANTLVLIPVAAHQEAANIKRAMALYAAQETREPFSVLLYMNHPKDADQESISATITAAQRAQADHPGLDLRISHAREIGTETTIGQLRNELWTAAARVGLKDGCFQASRDVIGLNHDIDLISLGRRHIDQVQAYYQDEVELRKRLDIGGLQPAYTRTRHAWSQPHPNISMFVALNDMMHLLSDSGYDASRVFPLSYFARAGGFYDSNYGEVQIVPTSERIPLIPTSLLETSPRRYLARLALYGPENIWTPAKDSFTSSDEYRTATTFTDISQPQLYELVHNGANHMHEIILDSIIETINHSTISIERPREAQELYDAVTAQIAKISLRKLRPMRRLLGSVLDDHVLASTLIPVEEDIVALCKQAVKPALRSYAMFNLGRNPLESQAGQVEPRGQVQMLGKWVPEKKYWDLKSDDEM